MLRKINKFEKISAHTAEMMS